LGLFGDRVFQPAHSRSALLLGLQFDVVASCDRTVTVAQDMRGHFGVNA
jgi:hypothetical protein